MNAATAQAPTMAFLPPETLRHCALFMSPHDVARLGMASKHLHGVVYGQLLTSFAFAREHLRHFDLDGSNLDVLALDAYAAAAMAIGGSRREVATAVLGFDFGELAQGGRKIAGSTPSASRLTKAVRRVVKQHNGRAGVAAPDIEDVALPALWAAAINDGELMDMAMAWCQRQIAQSEREGVMKIIASLAFEHAAVVGAASVLGSILPLSPETTQGFLMANLLGHIEFCRQVVAFQKMPMDALEMEAALLCACLEGRTDLALSFLDGGAEPTAELFDAAALNGHIDLVRHFLSRGFTPSPDQAAAILASACERGDLAMARLALDELRVDPASAANAALMAAARAAHPHMAGLLMEREEVREEARRSGREALTSAVFSGSVETVDALLGSGCFEAFRREASAWAHTIAFQDVAMLLDELSFA
ncbi:hypothetical protein HDU96_008643 [Phlyctochytrium bullatum]|nr:hypothetical protein HDU96_008643 [Phlyctochytrium bullatum]